VGIRIYPEETRGTQSTIVMLVYIYSHLERGSAFYRCYTGGTWPATWTPSRRARRPSRRSSNTTPASHTTSYSGLAHARNGWLAKQPAYQERRNTQPPACYRAGHSLGREEIREEAERLQLDGFLVKPVTKSMIVDHPRQCFGDAGEEAARMGKASSRLPARRRSILLARGQ